MILTVDIGNSRIKWAQWQEGLIVARAAAPYTLEKKRTIVKQLFSAVQRPSRVFAVCVAENEMRQTLNEWVKQHWQLDVAYLETAKQYKDIIHAYDDPGQHGVDRWAAMVAGRQSFPESSLCVISAGTAITFDLVNKNGRHLGGYILPSFATMHAALLADTANVHSISSRQLHNHSVPDNTSDAVNQGLHKLLQAGIREICSFAQDKLDAPMQIILTGGFAKTILDYPDMPVMLHKPDLVMQGLYTIMLQPNS